MRSLKTPSSLLAAGSLLLALATQGRAAITFSFDYSDPSAAAWTPEAKASLETAASMIASYFPSYTTTITMAVTGSNANTPTLASAGSNYETLTAGFGNRGVVGTKIQTGTDLNGSQPDGVVDANFFHSWSFTSSVSGSEYDFTDTMFHELGHAMGFISLIEQNGLSAFDEGMPGAFSSFDQFVVNGSGVSLVDHTTFTTNDAWAVASIGGGGTFPAQPNTGLYFNGPNAMAANGGNFVPLYSPAEWEPGSSGSHLDDTFFTGANQKTMNAATLPGLGVRQFSSIELGIWQDLGYSVVPEPGSAVLLLLGGLSGAFVRRRRN